ncbi:MAG: hypothetical protein EOO27_43090 [Comamonadaceae bacterium]|nr:MAG: hypothetical protein EOO27_43090 [Comamonadaceae bacterium]
MPTHYADLVAPALDKSNPLHRDALATLQAAGGIALIADGILIAGSGSTETGATGEKFVRSQPNRVVEKLGESAEGLWVLAHAADSFNAEQQAVNSFAPSTPPSKIPVDTYKVAFPSDDNLSTARLVSRDEPLFDLVRTAAGLREENPRPKGSESQPMLTPAELATKLATAVLDDVTQLTKRATELQGLTATPGVAPYTGMDQVWEDTKNGLVKLLTIVHGLEPAEVNDSFDDEDPYEDCGVEEHDGDEDPA